MKQWAIQNAHNLTFVLCIVPGGVLFVILPLLIQRFRPSREPHLA